MANELSIEEMVSVCKDICLLRPRRVVFTGGEPLLRNDIFDLAHALRSMGYTNHLCITTNGTLVNKDNAKELVEAFDEIRISIDGFKDVNDALRGKGSFEQTMKSLSYIIEAGGAPIAFITVTPLNIPILKEFMSYLLRNGVSSIHLSPVSLAGRASIRKDLLTTNVEVMTIATDFWYETFGLRLRSAEANCPNCGVGRYITVYPDGSIYPCHLLAFPELCLGTVRESRLYDTIAKSSLLNKLSRLDLQSLALCSKHLQKSLERDRCIGRCVQDGDRRKELVEYIDKESACSLV
jgi:radical SAM protein with 4Fe4S-binding SPASM domain